MSAWTVADVRRAVAEGSPRPLELPAHGRAAVLVPVILAYTAYAYWVFRGKVDQDHGYH